MKITLQELKQLIKESVNEMIETRHNAGMFSVAAVLDEPRVAEAIKKYKDSKDLLVSLAGNNSVLKAEIEKRLGFPL